MDIYKDRIKPLFDETGMTDSALEQEIGLPRSFIYNWNIGKTKSYKKYVAQIAAYFGVSTDYLLGNTDQKEKPATLGELVPGYNDLTEEAKKKVQEYIDLLLLQQNSK